MIHLLCFLVMTVATPRAAEPSPFAEGAFDEIVAWLEPEDVPAERWFPLATRIRESLRERLAVEPARYAPSYLLFWRPTLEAHVDALADQFAEVVAVKDFEPETRAARAIETMTHLTLAIAANAERTRGKAATLALGAFIGTTSALGAHPTYGPAYGLATGAGVGALAGGLTALGEWRFDLPRPNAEQTRARADAMIDRFWSRVGRAWTARDAGVDLAGADAQTIAERANEALDLEGALVVEICEREISGRLTRAGAGD